MKLVSLLCLLLPAPLSCNPVFLSPSNLPVIILGALGMTREEVRLSTFLDLLTELSSAAPWAAESLCQGDPFCAGALLH